MVISINLRNTLTKLQWILFAIVLLKYLLWNQKLDTSRRPEHWYGQYWNLKKEMPYWWNCVNIKIIILNLSPTKQWSSLKEFFFIGRNFYETKEFKITFTFKSLGHSNWLPRPQTIIYGRVSKKRWPTFCSPNHEICIPQETGSCTNCWITLRWPVAKDC